MQRDFTKLQSHFYIFGFVIINSQLPMSTKTRVKWHTTWGVRCWRGSTWGGGAFIVCPRGIDAPDMAASYCATFSHLPPTDQVRWRILWITERDQTCTVKESQILLWKMSAKNNKFTASSYSSMKRYNSIADGYQGWLYIRKTLGISMEFVEI